MPQHFRQFQVGPDAFGRTWDVEFRWLQTAISIRHADTVDVKFILTSDDGRSEEKVIALPHVELLKLSKERGRLLTDPWCMKLASLQIRHMIETTEDMEKTLVTLSGPEIARLDQELAGNSLIKA